ncbi:hypothetical protein [Streptomyces sp. NPDC058667]|uniref:hypothetical protein n=1 Tax=Streptomyces sp. NPDC058667 TaxID=3346588 RepID=UPI00365748B2
MPKPTGSHPEHTADGRYIVVGGRRWRATDPDVPEEPWWEQSATDRTARWRDGLEALDADSESGSGSVSDSGPGSGSGRGSGSGPGFGRGSGSGSDAGDA